jgi:membrane protease YdiL (CAAX protease family)
MNTETTAMHSGLKPVASYRHSIIFLGIVALITILGVLLSRNASGSHVSEAQSHSLLRTTLLTLTTGNWLLVYFVWKGLRAKGGSFRTLIQDRWTRGREVFRDLLLAAASWGVLLVLLRGMTFLLHTKSSTNASKGWADLVIGFVVSITAGFCEEFVFRGYAQKQLLAYTGRIWLAVLGQGILFGCIHAYGGWQPIIVSGTIGVLFGALAAWRKTLRIGMLTHAWTDFWNYWLKFAIFG